MGFVRMFIKELDKYEQTDIYKIHKEQVTLTSPGSIKSALKFIMIETKGLCDPKEIERLLYLEYHI